MSNAQPWTETFSMKELKCDKVVVYTDRAEVRRLLRTKLKKGENELVIDSITNLIDKDSVRVEGHGDATVLDVVCQNKKVERSKEETTDAIRILRAEIETFESDLEVKNQRLDRIRKQVDVLNTFASTLAKPSVGGSSDSQTQSNGGKLASSKENVDNFMNFINVYSTRMENLDKEKIIVQREIKELEEKLKVAKENLNKQTTEKSFTEAM
jgi:prefoldin subunit 5